MIENIEDHMALACGCGSTQWAYLRSGKIECHKCRTVHDISGTKSTKTLMELIRDKDMQLAALKTQNTEPVAWMFVNEDGECEEIFHEIQNIYTHDWLIEQGFKPLYSAPPTAEQAVKDFKQRAVKVCKQYEFDSAVEAIESLPLMG